MQPLFSFLSSGSLADFIAKRFGTLRVRRSDFRFVAWERI
jgi:hypothetical protein